MSSETDIQHPEPIELNPHNRAVVPPIYQSVKFEFDRYEAFLNPQEGDFLYSRISNPTVRQLELQLAKLQSCEDAFAFASGVSALAIPFLGLLKSGDHVLFFAESYMPTRYLLRELLGKFGISHTLLFYDELSRLEDFVQPQTKLIHFESPTNPTMTVPDISKIVSVAKKHKFLTMLDNTLSGLHQNSDMGIDLYVHSLTKYASGHGDVMGGAIMGSKELIRSLKNVSIHLGSTLDPHSAFLISRGLKTYFLRYRSHSENSKTVAEYLSGHPKIIKVTHPGFGGVFCIELSDSVSAPQFMNRLKYFRVAGSLGSTESLIVPAKRLFARDLTEEQQTRIGFTDFTYRLHVGLEDPKDLIQDLELALLIK